MRWVFDWSETGAKDVHFDDLAFQAHVLAGAGVKVRKLWLLLIDSAYVRHGEVRPRELFVRIDVTEQVQARVHVAYLTDPGGY